MQIETKAVGTTGTVYLGLGRPTVLYPLSDDKPLEDAFIDRMMTADGAEDLCIRMLASDGLDYGRLIDVAEGRGVLNVLGCYLDVLERLRPGTVPVHVMDGIMDRFKNGRFKLIHFHASDIGLPVPDWLSRLGHKWNVDIHLDIGAMEHTVRSL